MISNAEKFFASCEKMSDGQIEALAQTAKDLTRRFNYEIDVTYMSTKNPNFSLAMSAREDLLKLTLMPTEHLNVPAAQKAMINLQFAGMYFYFLIALRDISINKGTVGEKAARTADLYSAYLLILFPPSDQPAAMMMKATVEGAQRSRAIRSMATIGIQLPLNLDDRDLCQKATVAIVRKVAKDASQQPVWLGAGHRFTAAITGFTIANALTYQLAAPFEQVANTAVAILLGAEDDSDFKEVDEMAYVYNDLSAKPGIVESIGKSFSEWLLTPSTDNYLGLVAVYQVLAECVSE